MDETALPEGMSSELAGQFLHLRKNFVAGLAQREANMVACTNRADLYAVLHQLAGAAGIYGFGELERLTRTALEFCQGNDQQALDAALVALKNKLQNIQNAV